uniref:Uncharacterized protein n=1 Tax=Tanacetum cinerariifolium TaxID=118510 RepID=A0A699JA87_TANCI|nr:hypothetical protein [Tanacetum cinerariifolium]
METRGPSPLVPFLMLNIFAIIIFSPMGSYQHGDVATHDQGESGFGFGAFLLPYGGKLDADSFLIDACDILHFRLFSLPRFLSAGFISAWRCCYS